MGIEYALGSQAAPAAKQRIDSLRATVRARRRVTVVVGYIGCDGCKGELRIGKSITPLRASGGVARGTSPALAPGHTRAVVVLTAPGVRLTASRPVVIR